MSETEEKSAIFCKHCKRRIHPDDYSGSGFRHEEDWSISCSGTLAEPEIAEQRGVTLKEAAAKLQSDLGDGNSLTQEYQLIEAALEAYASSRLAEVTREISEGIKKENDDLQARLAEVTAQWENALEYTLQQTRNLSGENLYDVLTTLYDTGQNWKRRVAEVTAQLAKLQEYQRLTEPAYAEQILQNATLRAELERLKEHKNCRLKELIALAIPKASEADDELLFELAEHDFDCGGLHSQIASLTATVARLTGERDAGGPIKLAVPFQKELTVILTKNTSDKQADTDLATIADGKATVFRVGVPELYFHQLRLRVLKDASLKSKIAVFYLDENSKIWPIEDIENQLRWPVGFMEEIWHKEMDIQELKRPGLAESIRAKKEEDAKIRAALTQAQQALRPEKWIEVFQDSIGQWIVTVFGRIFAVEAEESWAKQQAQLLIDAANKMLAEAALPSDTQGAQCQEKK
jgi:hypothetical protein